MKTVWVFGDQLNRDIASLQGVTPGKARILMVRNETLIGSRRWHRQRLHLVLTGMRRFADDLRNEGFEVDERSAPSLTVGLAAHKKQFQPERVVAMETLSETAVRVLRKLGVELIKTNQMLCHYDDFGQWAGDAKHLRMEDFYRWQRRRYDILMDGDQPVGGRWNYDSENRLPPPKQPRQWYEPVLDPLDDLDSQVTASLPDGAFGAEPVGLWATTREGALRRLHDFIENVLPEFGPYEDAMINSEFRLAHSMLSHALNVGLLMPLEVVEAAENAYRAGAVPIASVEGFVRQIIGWREYIWNVYWRWIPEYRNKNELKAIEPLPPMFTTGQTNMQCMQIALDGVEERAWVHHIQRLMVFGNFALIVGIEPMQIVKWMWESFIDGAEWVMLANVIGLSLYADGGLMSTKPYAAGGAYINRMSDHCKPCRYDPKKRTGDDACPFTTLYWDFMSRHKARFAHNNRMAQPVRNLERLSDIDEVRKRARDVRALIRSGEL
jgi:deoxyribodipyrimidine photolyase-related protein